MDTSPLEYFHDLPSLSRASALANDMERQRTSLEAELAAAEAEVPETLKWVHESATSALSLLDGAAARCDKFEASVQAQLVQTTRLTQLLAPPRIRVQQLRDELCLAGVLLRTDAQEARR